MLKSVSITITLLLYCVVSNAQISLLGKFGYGHYIDENAPGIEIAIGLEQDSRSNISFGFSIGTFLSESKGKFAEIPPTHDITIGEVSMLKSIFALYDNNLEEGLWLLSTKPDKFTCYHVAVSCTYNLKKIKKHSIKSSLGTGISYVNSRKIAHIFEPTSLISPFAGELITPEQHPVSFIVFLYQRYLDLPFKIELEYLYNLNSEIELGLQLSYTKLMFSGNSILSFGGKINI